MWAAVDTTLRYGARVNVLARYIQRKWEGTVVSVNQVGVCVEEERRLGRLTLDFRTSPGLERYLVMLETLVPWGEERVEVGREQAMVILACVEQLERLARRAREGGR